jgi:hypothetical protein
VAGVISATMTEIDSTDERNVTIKTRGMANENHLLMVRSTSAHSLIEQNFTARLGHLNGEASILLGVEPEAVAVGTPKQSSNVDTSSTSVGDEGNEGCSVWSDSFVRVSAPIGEANLVVTLEARDDLYKTVEI